MEQTNRSKAIKKEIATRFRKHQKAIPANQDREIKKAIKKAQTSPLSTLDILSILKFVPRFLGVFASDELKHLKIIDYPVSLIANLDTSITNGSHWVAIRISSSNIELFDSLGFCPETWSRFPSQVINFLKTHTTLRKLSISPTFQAPNTHLCGLYCIYFVLYRRIASFSLVCSKFSRIDLNSNTIKLKNLLLN